MIMDSDHVINVLLLGDSGIGKSTFLTRLTVGMDGQMPVRNLRDMDQPFPFDIRLKGQSFRLAFYDTASPTNYTLLEPSVIILCYSIASPESLVSLSSRWKTIVETHFNHDESIPVIVLGLQRDVRSKDDYDGRVRPRLADDAHGENDALTGRTFSYPQEALRVAQAMRCDRYCECSAVTGDLCREVFEDIAKTAALTLTEEGGKSKAPNCTLM